MNIEKLDEDKIRITLNMNDLEEKKVDFHSFMSNSIESQELFLDMLEEAEKEVGFVTDDYRIMVEAIALTNGNFIFTITRSRVEITPEKYKRKKVHSKRKINYLNNNKSIYKFQNFDEFCAFCHSLNIDSSINYSRILLHTSLYLYKNNYYLVFSNVAINSKLLKKVSSIISEFGYFISSSDYLERKLKEHGNVIMSSKAIATCLKHF